MILPLFLHPVILFVNQKRIPFLGRLVYHGMQWVIPSHSGSLTFSKTMCREALTKYPVEQSEDVQDVCFLILLISPNKCLVRKSHGAHFI